MSIIGSLLNKGKRRKGIVFLSKPKHFYTLYPIPGGINASFLELPAGRYKIKVNERGVFTLEQVAYYI